MDGALLKTALVAGRVVITFHADQEAHAEALNLTEVRQSVVTNGDLIKDDPTDPRGLSCLILSFLSDGCPVHSCWGIIRSFD